MSRRVAITGIGLVTPLGASTAQTWNGICRGDSGIVTLDDPALADYPVRIAGLVRGEHDRLDACLSQKEQQRTDRFIHLTALAASEALAQADLSLTVSDKQRAGVFVGVGLGGLNSIIDAVRTIDHSGMRRLSPFIIPKLISNEAASIVSMHHDLRGPTLSISTACSSGADAIGQAMYAIRHGVSDVMVAGGAEHVISPLAIAGFGNMRALAQWQGDPTEASRPFDRDRCGFVMAEGAGMLVLEELSRAQKRGATIYAEVVGYAATNDAHHMAAIHPEGRGARAAITNALADAQCVPSDIGYINAHGTSTQMNDAIEAAAIRDIFGETQPYVSSTKSMTGHMLGAAGGVEIGLSALTLHHQVAPATRNLTTSDCDIRHVPAHGYELKAQYAMSNSFGFGGANTAVVLKQASNKATS